MAHAQIVNSEWHKASRNDLIESHFKRGQCLIELQRFKEAIGSFDVVIELKATHAEAYYWRGLAKVYLNHSNSIKDFNRALSVKPHLFEAYLARACIYAMQGRITKAILNCNQVVKLNARSVRGFLYRGALKYLSRGYEYAIDDLNEAIRLDHTCTLAYYNRSLCYQQIKQYKHAIRDLSIVLLLGDYLKFRVLVNRAIIYFSFVGDYSNALSDFTLAARLSPGNYHVEHMIGVCLHKWVFPSLKCHFNFLIFEPIFQFI